MFAEKTLNLLNTFNTLYFMYLTNWSVFYTSIFIFFFCWALRRINVEEVIWRQSSFTGGVRNNSTHRRIQNPWRDSIRTLNFEVGQVV
jgi:hypothetical protein